MNNYGYEDTFGSYCENNIAGAAFVLFGHFGKWATIRLSNHAHYGFAIHGTYGDDKIGPSLSEAGDLNRDVYDDVKH